MKPHSRDVPATLNAEFHKKLQTLRSKFSKSGRPVLNEDEAEHVISFAAATDDQDGKRAIQARLLAPLEVPASLSEKGLSKTRLEIFAKIYWRNPDFTMALLTVFRRFDRRRDTLDNQLAMPGSMTETIASIADRVNKLDAKKNADRISDDAVKKRRKRLREQVDAIGRAEFRNRKAFDGVGESKVSKLRKERRGTQIPKNVP